MTFQIALGGALAGEPGLCRRMDEYLGQTKGFLAGSGEEVGLRLLYCPSYADAAWRDWARSSGCACTEFLAGDASSDGAEQTVRVDSPLRSSLGALLCDRADLLLIVWNEDVTERDGATWELLRSAQERHTPCIWVSSRTLRAYWPERSCYEPFAPGQLRDLCGLTVGAETEPAANGDRPIPLLSLGRRCYHRFLRRYRAERPPMDAKEDRMLHEDYRLEGGLSDGEPLRRSLLERFRRFDRAAIEWNERYQSVLYWRAILPFITSLIVAVGFYSSSVLAALPVFSRTTWEIIGGFAFLIHGFLNLYVFLLSRSATVRDYQAGMVKNRQRAECLRVLLHFEPFGIHLDLRRLSGDDRALGASLRRMTEDAGLQPRRIDGEHMNGALDHVEELLSDQLAYHSACQTRYSGIVDHLERWGKAVFYVSFIVVLLRALLQFLVALPNFPLPALLLGNAVQPKSFILSFANMLALLTPAWYAYFVSKQSLGNFRFNRDNHQRMRENMERELENVRALRASGTELPAEALRVLGESLAATMLLQDLSLWVRQYEGTRVTHL